MIVTPTIEKQFNTWLEPLRRFIESEEMGKLYGFLKEQSKLGKTIIPDSTNVWKSFELCDYEKVRAVVVLMDPYPSMTKDNKKIANGVPLDCSSTNIPQPSLIAWWKQVEESYYSSLAVDMDLRNDLSYLLKEEHVLLINSSLTTEKDKPGVHANQWQPFMKYLFNMLNENKRGLCISLSGAQAQKYEKEINPLIHYIHKCEHPVNGPRNNRDWDSNNLFKWCNQILEANNGYGIRWVRNIGEEAMDKVTAPPWIE